MNRKQENKQVRTEVQGTRHFGGIKRDGIQFRLARRSVSASSVTPTAHLQALSLKEAVGSAGSLRRRPRLPLFLSSTGRVDVVKSAKLPLIVVPVIKSLPAFSRCGDGCSSVGHPRLRSVEAKREKYFFSKNLFLSSIF